MPSRSPPLNPWIVGGAVPRLEVARAWGPARSPRTGRGRSGRRPRPGPRPGCRRSPARGGCGRAATRRLVRALRVGAAAVKGLAAAVQQRLGAPLSVVPAGGRCGSFGGVPGWSGDGRADGRATQSGCQAIAPTSPAVSSNVANSGRGARPSAGCVTRPSLGSCPCPPAAFVLETCVRCHSASKCCAKGKLCRQPRPKSPVHCVKRKFWATDARNCAADAIFGHEWTIEGLASDSACI